MGGERSRMDQVNDARGGRVRRPLRDSMSVQAKFLLVTGLILLFNCLMMALIIYHHEKSQLELAAHAKSELVMAAVEASRSYVREELRPAMYRHLGPDYFVPEAMSTSYVGRAVVERLAPAMEEFNYRRVAINARNLRYEANQLELRMIDFFGENPQLTEWRGLVEGDHREKWFMRFRPVRFERECLDCHGSPDAAPAVMVESYGADRGFGRYPGELAGLIAVGVPVEAALAKAREKAVSIFLVVFAGMAMVFMALNFFFHRMVVINLRGLLEIFQDHGDQSPPDPQGCAAELAEVSRALPYKDELAELTVAACTMAGHLHRTREQLRRYARELESRVEDRTRALRLTEARLQQKELEEKIRQAEKMVAMGQLVAGLAHEINNPLGIILCYLDLVKRQAPTDPQALRDLEVIEKQARSCKRIVSDLLDFARGGKGNKEQVSLNRVIEEVAGMVAPQFGKQGVEVRLELAPELPQLWLDVNKIKQVILNLLMNSRQAMPEGGGRIEIGSSWSAEAGVVRVRVWDNGRGIAPENLGKIFDPFFSTKGTGEGTGLGLSVSYGIIKEHGGEIEVSSQPGEWTCFVLDLPVAAHDPEREEER